MELLAILSISICIPIVILFGILALFLSKGASPTHSPTQDSEDTMFFLTARNSQSALRIGWSFYASTIGAGALFAPVAFSVDQKTGAGWLGLISYSVFIGLPILLVAWLGAFVKRQYPDVSSIGQFARQRFGPAVEILVTSLVIFNLFIAMSAEYTGIGDLFSTILGAPSWIPIVTVGLTTLVYTTVGGLYTSILTDQYQSVFSIFLLLVMILYVILTFRPGPLPPLPPNLDLNIYGLNSVISMSLALGTSCFYSDAMWQRVWSSASDKDLFKGAIFGASLSSVVLFLFGFAGFMASWAGYSTDANTAFFSILKGTPDQTPPIWITLVVSVFAITMNESAIDSLQNAITDSVIALALSYNVKFSLHITQIFVVILNLPIMIIGLQGFNIASLYLVANMTTACATFPIALGLVPSLRATLNSGGVFFGSGFGLSLVLMYGTFSTGSLIDGLSHYFFESYDAVAFLLGSVGSILGVLIWIGFTDRIKLSSKDMRETVFLHNEDLFE